MQMQAGCCFQHPAPPQIPILANATAAILAKAVWAALNITARKARCAAYTADGRRGSRLANITVTAAAATLGGALAPVSETLLPRLTVCIATAARIDARTSDADFTQLTS